jgi:hypothetical protein
MRNQCKRISFYLPESQSNIVYYAIGRHAKVIIERAIRRQASGKIVPAGQCK